MTRSFWPSATLAAALTLTGGLAHAFDLGSAVSAAGKGLKAATLSDAEGKSIGGEACMQKEYERPLPPADHEKNPALPENAPHPRKQGNSPPGKQQV